MYQYHGRHMQEGSRTDFMTVTMMCLHKEAAILSSKSENLSRHHIIMHICIYIHRSEKPLHVS